MTAEEYKILHDYICGKYGPCSECPINDWVPCSVVTPEKEMLRRALAVYDKYGDAGMQTLGILSRYLKAVIV